MNNFFKLTLGFLLLISTNSFAAHLVGGEMHYDYIGHNADTTIATFQVTFTMYRDAAGGGADFDSANQTQFGVYRRNQDGNWILYNTVNNIGPQNITEVLNEYHFCLSNDPAQNLSLEKGTYVFEVELEVVDTDYMISYQRCCRSEIISNVQTPGEIGSAFDVVISETALKTGNSSPRFINIPPLFLCAETDLNIQQEAIDPDGDLLRYSFCPVYQAGGTDDSTGPNAGNIGCCSCVRPHPNNCPPPYNLVNYTTPFTANMPLGDDLSFSTEGTLSGKVSNTGFFTVGLCVEEYRNGILLSKVRRDYAILVTECEIDSISSDMFFADTDGDTYGDPEEQILGCDKPDGYVHNDRDCDDTDLAINPDAEDEEGNGVDENCDGVDGLSSVFDSNKQIFSLFPNPVNSTLHLTGISDVEPFEILNIYGQVILNGNTIGRTLDVSQLGQGLYYFRVQEQMRVFVKL